MDLRNPLSKLKNKFKCSKTGRKQKPNETGDPGGGRGDLAGSLPQLDPHLLAGGGYNQEDGRAKKNGWQVRSTNQPPRSHHDGSESDQKRGEADVNGGGTSRIFPHPHSDAEVMAGGGPSREGDDADREKIERVHPPPSTLSIPGGGGPDGV